MGYYCKQAQSQMAGYKQSRPTCLPSSVLYTNTLQAPILAVFSLLCVNSSPAGQALLPPLPRVTAACGSCKTVRPSELNYMLHWADWDSNRHPTTYSLRGEGVIAYLIKLLLFKDLYSYLWCSGISLSPLSVIIQSRQGMKWHFLITYTCQGGLQLEAVLFVYT